MTTARTRVSLFHWRSTSAISARIGVSQALSFHGLLSVTVAMPSLISVRTGRSFEFGMMRNVSTFGAAVSQPRLCARGRPVNADACRSFLVLHKSLRSQAAMEPVHQGYHVEHRQAREAADVSRIGREVRAFENERADAGVGPNCSLSGLQHLAL